MDLWTALRTIGRHWLVLLLGLVVTGAVLLVLDARVEQRYSATGTVVVITPGGHTNPIDIYSSSSSLAASVATTLGSDDASKATVANEGGTSDYTLVPDPSLPVITITTTSANPDTAVRSFGLVSQLMNRLLADRQRTFSSPPGSTLKVLSVTTPATAKVTSYKLTVLAIAGVLGALVAIGLTFIADSTGERRRLRRPRVQRKAASVPALGETPKGGAGGKRRSFRPPDRLATRVPERPVSPEPAAETVSSQTASEQLPLPKPDTEDRDVPAMFELPAQVQDEQPSSSAPTYEEFLATHDPAVEEPAPQPTAPEGASQKRLGPITVRRRPPGTR